MTTLSLQNAQKAERLTDAFRLFNQLSQNLSSSYQSLEEQIARLNQELAAARSERLATLLEKEKIANRLQQILAALPAAVIVLNADGMIVDCNNHAIDFLGEPLIGLYWRDVEARSFNLLNDSPHERQLCDGRKVSVTRDLLSNDGEQIILLSDISELRHLQDQLSQRQHLSAMGEMVASLAHQVRTPLATAILYASQMQKPALNETKRQQFSQKILERLHFLERQVNDMLIFAKQGRMAMETFSLGEMLTDALEALGNFDGRLQIDNALERDQLQGNRDALCGALGNLLNNAVEAGATRIVLRIQANDQRLLQLSVADDGCGISQAQQSRLFEPFYTSKINGTGLGLAVVDSVVRAHHGHLQCQSDPGNGSIFTMWLPCLSDDALTLSSGQYHQENHHESV